MAKKKTASKKTARKKTTKRPTKKASAKALAKAAEEAEDDRKKNITALRDRRRKADDTEPVESKDLGEQRETRRVRLKYTLTDAERLDLGDEVAQANEQIGELEQERKAAAEEFKGRIHGVQVAMDEKLQTLRRGYREEYVDCHVQVDTRLLERRYIHPETGEVIRKEPIEKGRAHQGDLIL